MIIKSLTPAIKSALLKVDVPVATKSYQPVSHKQIINMTLEELDKNNLKVLSESYKMAREGRQAAGFYEIGAKGDSEMRIRLGWHNSYDKSMPVRWAIGGHIIVCENGMVAGDLGAFKRKHTGTVLEDYTTQCQLHISSAGEMYDRLIREKQRMKEIEITKRASAELIGRMFLEEDLITATQLGIIKREMDNPSFDYKANGTVWQLYNHCTVAYKEEHPSLIIDRHVKHHDFFTKEFELV
jgi:hypothetical protein